MATNTLIIPTTIKSPLATARATAANVSYSGTSVSGLVLLYTSPTASNGSQMTRLRARPIYASGSTSFPLTQVQLFKVDTSCNVCFDDDATIPAQSLVVSGTSTPAPTAPADFGYSIQSKRDLPPGWSWYVGISAAWSPGVSFAGDINDY